MGQQKSRPFRDGLCLKLAMIESNSLLHRTHRFAPFSATTVVYSAYTPQANPREEADRKRLRELWKKKYGY